MAGESEMPSTVSSACLRLVLMSKSEISKGSPNVSLGNFIDATYAFSRFSLRSRWRMTTVVMMRQTERQDTVMKPF